MPLFKTLQIPCVSPQVEAKVFMVAYKVTSPPHLYFPILKPCLQLFLPGMFFLWFTPFHQVSSNLTFPKKLTLALFPTPAILTPFILPLLSPPLYLVFLPYAIRYLFILFTIELHFLKLQAPLRQGYLFLSDGPQGPRRARCTTGAQEILLNAWMN